MRVHENYSNLSTTDVRYSSVHSNKDRVLCNSRMESLTFVVETLINKSNFVTTVSCNGFLVETES